MYILTTVWIFLFFVREIEEISRKNRGKAYQNKNKVERSNKFMVFFLIEHCLIRTQCFLTCNESPYRGRKNKFLPGVFGCFSGLHHGVGFRIRGVCVFGFMLFDDIRGVFGHAHVDHGRVA